MSEKTESLGKSNDDRLPDELEREFMARGPDSSVDKLSKIEHLPIISKKYTSFQTRHHLLSEEVIEILNKYREDTRRVKLFLEKNPNPINQGAITNNGEKWQISFVVVPQGDNIQKGKDGIVYVEGQDFIAGKSYWDLFYNKKNEKLSAKNGYKDFVLSGIEFYVPHDCLRMLSSFIKEKLGVNFSIDPVNVKPRIDRQQKILYMYITDLAASLYASYLR